MCPDWESNWQLFGSQAGAQPPEPQQPEHPTVFKAMQKEALTVTKLFFYVNTTVISNVSILIAK